MNLQFSTGPLTKQETSVVISISNVGGLAGNWLVLPLGGIVGLKRATHMLAIPMIVRFEGFDFQKMIHSMNVFQILFYFFILILQMASVLTIYAQNVYYLYVSRVLSGMAGGGLSVLITSLINDIANNKYAFP